MPLRGGDAERGSDGCEVITRCEDSVTSLVLHTRATQQKVRATRAPPYLEGGGEEAEADDRGALVGRQPHWREILEEQQKRLEVALEALHLPREIFSTAELYEYEYEYEY